MFVDIYESDDDAQPCEVYGDRQQPYWVQMQCRADHREHGHKPAEEFDKRVPSGDRLMTVAALASQHQVRDDGNVVMPAYRGLAVWAETPFRVDQADAVRHTPDDHVEERTDKASDHERDGCKHHGCDTVAERVRIQMRDTIADQNITGGKDGGSQHSLSPLPVHSVLVLSGCVADG